MKRTVREWRWTSRWGQSFSKSIHRVMKTVLRVRYCRGCSQWVDYHHERHANRNETGREVVSIIEWRGEYAVARVEVLGPSIDPMTKEPFANVDPLRFDGRFGR